MSSHREALFDKVASTIEGEPVDDAVFALVFSLASCLHQITDGVFEAEAVQEIQFLTVSAYRSICGAPVEAPISIQ